ncbi:MAG: hypothetical protein PHZ19_05705 [Candidatus Thermoplasmatota archaeon]|nr:hypothetical protein [Candidatus Thermoplasmatota archaeon]
MIAKNVHFLASSYEYVAPHYSDVRLDSLFRVLFAIDSAVLTDYMSAPEAALTVYDELITQEALERLFRIGATFEDFVSDIISALDSAELEAILVGEDAVRSGDSLALVAGVDITDGVEVEEEAMLYTADYGRKWGMLRGVVPTYQEKK